VRDICDDDADFWAAGAEADGAEAEAAAGGEAAGGGGDGGDGEGDGHRRLNLVPADETELKLGVFEFSVLFELLKHCRHVRHLNVANNRLIEQVTFKAPSSCSPAAAPLTAAQPRARFRLPPSSLPSQRVQFSVDKSVVQRRAGVSSRLSTDCPVRLLQTTYVLRDSVWSYRGLQQADGSGGREASGGVGQKRTAGPPVTGLA
jgi:hypothetical protein